MSQAEQMIDAAGAGFYKSLMAQRLTGMMHTRAPQATTHPVGNSALMQAAIAAQGHGVANANMHVPAPPAQMVPYTAPSGIGTLSIGDAIELAKGDASIFGMDSGSVGIPAGTTVNIRTQPQRDCVPVRLIVSDSLADTFAISQIQVGVDPVMITPGTNCSLAAFTPGSFAPDFRATLLRAPIDFSVTITNLSGLAARFLASVFAIYLPPLVR